MYQNQQAYNRRTPSPGSQRIQGYPAASRAPMGNSLLQITSQAQTSSRNRLLELGNNNYEASSPSLRSTVSPISNGEGGAGVRDRTSEFFATVESMLSRQMDAPMDAQALLRKGNGYPSKKTQFAQEAAQIGKEINQTTVKLGELAKLAKRKGLFDDKSEEINQLMFVIKQDIAKINQRIAGLSNALAQMKKGQSPQLTGKQAEDHAQHVVLSLQSKLATTSSQFKDILELRTQNLKESKQRKDQYGVAVPTPIQANSSPFSTSGLPPPDASSTPVPLNFGQTGGFQSQELVQSNTYNDYVSSRAQAIESIESTIAELGQIYSNFMTILAGQREMVQRIDDNVQDVEMNVEAGHNQLLKYYQNMTSNRWLMLKIFAIVMFFFMVFVMML